MSATAQCSASKPNGSDSDTIADAPRTTRSTACAIAIGLSDDESSRAVFDMLKMIVQAGKLGEGAVKQADAAKAALGIFAADIQRTVPEIARVVGRSEAESNAIPGLKRGLEEQIALWRRL